MVVVTGCDTGIGYELVGQLLKHTSFHVVAVCLTQEGAARFSDQARCTAVKADVTVDSDVQRIKSSVTALIKEGHATALHCVVNNAGISLPGGFLWHQNIRRYQQVMDVNFFGQVRVAIALAPLLLNVEGARILSMSSVCGTCSLPWHSPYSASKWAVEAWSDAMRTELRRFGVHVVKIRPAMIDTGMQRNHGDRFLECFHDASGEIQQMYGGENFVENVIVDRGAAGHGADVSCCEKIVEIIQLEKPKPVYYMGDSRFFKVLASLPVSMSDAVKLTFPGVRRPT